MERTISFIIKLALSVVTIFVWEMMYAQQKKDSARVDSFSVQGDYSIGKAFYSDGVSNEGSLGDEKKWPYQIEIMTGRLETGIQLKAFIHTDSTFEYVQLEIKKDLNQNLHYDLRDVDGRTILKEEITKDKTKIDFSKRPCSSYFLVICDNKATVKTFKIVKAI